MVGRMISFEHSDADMMRPPVMPSRPDVPPGLCICFTDRELEMLDLDGEEVEDGDLLHLMIMIKVTAVHKEGGTTRIEASIVGGRVEDESKESMDEEGR